MKIIFCILIMFMSSLAIFSQVNADLEKLVETEKAFAKTALDESVKQAFLKFLADDGVLFQPAAVNGKKAWQKRPESPALLAWNPVWADISANGEIGYTTGDWDFRPKGKDDEPIAFGQYITIWKKQTDGNFRAVLDIGISHEKPEAVERVWSFPKQNIDVQNIKPAKKSLTLRTENLGKLFSEDVRLYRNEKFPFIGKKNALREIQDEQVQIKNSKILTQKCESLEDFGYCYGEIERIKKDDSRERGNLMQIWKFRNGSWQIVLDIYTPIPEKIG